MSDTGTLDGLEVLAFVRRWFRALNDHAPQEMLLAMLADDGFELRFPQASLTDSASFAEWYHAITHQYFDQTHEVKQVTTIAAAPGRTEVAVWVNWRASSWQPPAGYSTRTDFDAFQSWLLVAGPDGRPRIKRYVVEQLVEN